MLSGIPVAGGLIETFAGLYLLLVAGRLIGLLYRQYEERLGWFKTERVEA